MIDEKILLDALIPVLNKHGDMYLAGEIVGLINSQSKTNEWIPCEDGKNMPEEHVSMFAKFKGTDKWTESMFEKISDNVNVTVEFEDGQRRTMTLHTIDGKWVTDIRLVKFKVIAWQPLPIPYLL